VRETESIKLCQENTNSGQNVAFFNFDGPRDESGGLLYLEVTVDMLIERINNPTFHSDTSM
jgi:hypothetical protein